MPQTLDSVAFPTLTSEELDGLRPFGTSVDFADSAPIFLAGQSVIDLYVVEAGAIEIQNPVTL